MLQKREIKKRKYPYGKDNKSPNNVPILKTGMENTEIAKNQISDIISFDDMYDINIETDGNWFYRTISQTYFNSQDFHKEIRIQIYEYANLNKE